MKKQPSNYLAEWFGHRLYPVVTKSTQALDDQISHACPFLSNATGVQSACIKTQAALGVCTVSSTSNGPRQDWLVCPHRALDARLLEEVVIHLFHSNNAFAPLIAPISTLQDENTRRILTQKLALGHPTFIYFHEKLGEEISFAKTPRSPEMKLDLTIVEILARDNSLEIGRYGILELQTMEFHGSYRYAVRDLQDALRLFGERFHDNVEKESQWLSKNIEGPNIANVFKRTFYQMMFKFQIGAQQDCAGCVLAISEAVWDSWQHHLGRPDLLQIGDVFALVEPGREWAGHIPAWIFVYDLDAASGVTPNPLRIVKRIATDADSIGYYALKLAPQTAISEGGSISFLPQRIKQRIKMWWPEFGERMSLPGDLG